MHVIVLVKYTFLFSIFSSMIQSPIPPEFVFWYHNDRLLNFDPSRAGVSVETEHGSRTLSQLKMTNALETDTGNYTCRASNGQPASIYVQVWSGNRRSFIIYVLHKYFNIYHVCIGHVMSLHRISITDEVLNRFYCFQINYIRRMQYKQFVEFFLMEL